MRTTIPLLLCLALLAGCGGDPSDGGDKGAASPRSTDPLEASCDAMGAALRTVAKDNQFDTSCLAAPANTEVKLELVNEDPFAHNLSIYEEKGGAAIFTGDYVQGKETGNYTVPGHPARRAYFVCDIHPHMEGVFIFE